MAINGLNSNSIKMAGLASGLDTEALVKQMSALSKGRLNMQQQKLDLLQWKQAEYRKATSSITSFKDTYFNLLKPDSNLGSSSVFATRKYTSSNDDLKVIVANSAAEGKYELSNVIQKATTAELTSENASVNGIKLDVASKEGQEYKVNVNLDGMTKEVTFIGGATNDRTAKNFADALDEAFAGTNANFKAKDGVLTVRNTEMTDLCHNMKITSATNDDNTIDSEGLKALGVADGASNQISIATKLSDVAFTNELKGNGFTFEINGEKFSFSKDNTINDVIKTVNASDADVKMSFDKVSGKFNLESTNSGASSSLKITQTSGNLLSSMFGADKIGEASAVSSNSLMSNGIVGVKPNAGEGFGFNDEDAGDISGIINQSFNITVNGEEKRIGLFSHDADGNKVDFTSATDVVNQLNQEIKNNFGADAPTFSYNSEDKTFTLTSANKADVISISAREDSTGGSQKLVTALGFNATNSTNEISQDQLLFEGVEGVNATISFGEGKTLTIDSNSTIKDLVDGSFGNITFDNGQITLHGVDIDGTDEAGKTYLGSLFGENYNYPGVPAANAIPSFEATGENAIITLNGNTITSNSNSFTTDGTTIDISGLDVGEQEVSVEVSNDTSKAKESIKSFVEDYNKLVDELYKDIKTKYDRDYQPLTEEQREEMSDKEIEQWEEKAKTGLLYQDSTISRFLTDFRTSVSGTAFKGMTLADMGITTSSNYSENGKLTLDEAKLDKALTENSEDIAAFFTDTSSGFAARVSATLDEAVKTTGEHKGSLVSLAGVENTSSVAENRISKQIESYKLALETLEDRYASEQERYWKQFTALETAMNSYNSQSSWLASQFSAQ